MRHAGTGPWVCRRLAVIEMPSRLLRAIAGPDAAPLIPLRLIELATPTLEVRIYPFDVTPSGRRADVVRARAAIADRLGVTAAYLTTGGEAQAVEDRLETLADRLNAASDEGAPAKVLPPAAHAAAGGRVARARSDDRDARRLIRGLGGPSPIVAAAGAPGLIAGGWLPTRGLATVGTTREGSQRMAPASRAARWPEALKTVVCEIRPSLNSARPIVNQSEPSG